MADAFNGIILMQYAEFKDTSRKEKEIYRGDILAINQIGVGEDMIREVYFEKGRFTISGGWSLYDVVVNHKKCEVIGNKYEDPKLRK